MTTNPYESPENPSNLPKPLTGWATIVFRLFAVVIILGLLVVLLLPFRRGPGPRRAAQRMQCSNHLKQIGLALQNYHDTFGLLPPAYTTDTDAGGLQSQLRPRISSPWHGFQLM
jgi:hypothetical protein